MSSSAPSDDPLTRPEPWNAVAAGYDDAFFWRAADLTEAAIERLAPAASSAVLDLATGPGTFAVRVAKRVARVVAVDFAESMVERLRAHARREGLENVEAYVMDGQALELPDASFDAAASLFGWFLFADRARGLEEIERVVKPGARVLVTSWSTPDRNTVLGNGMEALRAALPDLPRPPSPPPTQIPEVCASEMRAAGFESVSTELVGLPMPLGSVDEYWKMFESGGAPIAVLQKKLGAEAWRAVSERALAHLRERLGTGPIELRAEAIFTSGVRRA